jgi:hypothetical protein
MKQISRTWFTGLMAVSLMAASVAAFASGGTSSGGVNDPGVSSGGGGGTGGGGTGGGGTGGGGTQPSTVCVPLVSSVSFAPPVVVGGPDQVVLDSTYSNCTSKDQFLTTIIEFGALDSLGNFISAQAYYGPASGEGTS